VNRIRDQELKEMGIILESARKKKRWSQRELMSKMNHDGTKISYSRVSEYEMGNIKNPTQKLLRAFAKALDLSYEDLFAVFARVRYGLDICVIGNPSDIRKGGTHGKRGVYKK